MGLLLIENLWIKFFWATGVLLFLLKVGSIINNYLNGFALPKGFGWVGYFLLWPGMRPESFSKKVKQIESIGKVFVIGFLFFIIGIILQLILFFFWDKIPNLMGLYIGIFSILLSIHFGFSSILFVGHRFFGWRVEYLFKNPFLSESLKDFWSRRWNLAFVDMDKRLFLPLFSRKLPKNIILLSIFIISGFLHELAISYPVNNGWGGPMLYFVCHSLFMLIEPKVIFFKTKLLKRIWVWAMLLIPDLIFYLVITF